MYCNAVGGDPIKGAMKKIINLYKAKAADAKFKIATEVVSTPEKAIDILERRRSHPTTLTVTTSIGEHRYGKFSYTSTKSFLEAENIIEGDAIEPMLAGVEHFRITCSVDGSEVEIFTADIPTAQLSPDRETTCDSMFREAKERILASVGEGAVGVQTGRSFIVTKDGEEIIYRDFEVNPALPTVLSADIEMKAFREYHRLSYFEPMTSVPSVSHKQEKGDIPTN